MTEPAVRIEPYIREFLERDLPARPGVETVVLCGSHAAGRATARSDVDFCYIGAFEAFRRECLHEGGREFRLMIAPWSWYEHVVEEYERRGNVVTVTAMRRRNEKSLEIENARSANRKVPRSAT